jgi:hypothetical protein
MPWGNDPTVKPAPQSLREQQVRKGLGAQDVTIAQGRANLAKAPTEQAIAETTLAKARQELRNTPDAPKLTEAQSSNRAYYALMTSGEEAYNKAIAQGYDPGTAENIGATIVDKMFGGIIDSPGDIFRNSASKLGESGKVRFMEGYKRPLSGAAVGEAKQSTELPSMRKTVFPGPFSSGDEQLAINDAQARQDFRRSMGVAGGIPFKSAKPVQAGVTDEAWEKAAEIYNSAPKGANRSRGSQYNPIIPRNKADYSAIQPGQYFVNEKGNYGVMPQQTRKAAAPASVIGPYADPNKEAAYQAYKRSKPP